MAKRQPVIKKSNLHLIRNIIKKIYKIKNNHFASRILIDVHINNNDLDFELRVWRFIPLSIFMTILL